MFVCVFPSLFVASRHGMQTQRLLYFPDIEKWMFRPCSCGECCDWLQSASPSNYTSARLLAPCATTIMRHGHQNAANNSHERTHKYSHTNVWASQCKQAANVATRSYRLQLITQTWSRLYLQFLPSKLRRPHQEMLKSYACMA